MHLKKNIFSDYIKLLVLLSLVFFNLPKLHAQEANRVYMIDQSGDLHIKLWHSKDATFDFVYASISITNLTNDILRVRIEYDITSLGGNYEKWEAGNGGSNGTVIKPGETLEGQSRSCSYQFYLHNSKSIYKDNKAVDPVHAMSFRILKVENISKLEREKAQAEKEKQEQSKKIAEEKQAAIEKQKALAEAKEKQEKIKNENSQNTNYSNQNNSTKLSKEDNNYLNNGGEKMKTQQNTNSANNTNSYANEQQKIRESNNLLEQGNNLNNSGDFEGAQAKFNEALKLNPNNAVALKNRTIALQNEINKSEAEKHNKAVLDQVLFDQAKAKVITEAYVKIGGAVANAVIGFMNDHAEKKREEARRAQAARIEEEARLEKVASRKKLVTNFNQAKMPVTAQTRNINEVYFFMYKCDEAALETNAPYLYLSNIFSISKYADGTWPFMNTVTEKIVKATKESNYKLVGYFSNKADADAKLQEFISSGNAYGFTIKDVLYNTQQPATKANTSNTDFWGNPIKEKSTDKDIENNKKPDTDFWGNPIKN